jgi:Fur family ferric uptake transcriptional regulator
MDQIKELTKNSTFRVTKAREEILKTLMNASKPLCYDDFDLSMDKATFYRNISKFEEENLIQKFESEDRKWYFEITSSAHAHFLCRKCKGIECIEEVPIDLKGYLVESVMLKGICKKCLQMKRDSE